MLGQLPARGLVRLEGWQVDVLDEVIDSAVAAHAAHGDPTVAEGEALVQGGAFLQGEIHRYDHGEPHRYGGWPAGVDPASAAADDGHWRLQVHSNEEWQLLARAQEEQDADTAARLAEEERRLEEQRLAMRAQEERDAETAAQLAAEEERAQALAARWHEEEDTKEALRQQAELEAEESRRRVQEQEDAAQAKELEAALQAETVGDDGFVRVQRTRHEVRHEVRHEARHAEAHTSGGARVAPPARGEHLHGVAPPAAASPQAAALAAGSAAVSPSAAQLPTADPTVPKRTIVIDALNVGRSYNLGFTDPDLDPKKREACL